jgi:hypothetical protein
VGSTFDNDLLDIRQAELQLITVADTLTLDNIVTCRLVCMMKMMGSSSDVWIY